jgi:hypothetical protein
MDTGRRMAALAGIAAMIAAPAIAAAQGGAGQGGGEQGVAQAVEALRKAMLEPERATLEPLCAEALSYGHSAGRIETKAQFIDNLLAKTAAFRTITHSGQTIAVSGDEAIVRHVLDGETESQGKVTPVHIGVLQVWQRQAGHWRLLARQAFRL